MNDTLWAIVSSSATTSALLAFIAFFGKSKLAHWLSKDLEQIKSQYARELEAYKVSLIAETERIKAAQDIRKAAALMITDRKYTVLMELYDSIEGVPAQLFGIASLRTLDNMRPYIAEAQVAVQRISKAQKAARPFLTNALHIDIVYLTKELQQFLAYIIGSKQLPEPEEEQNALLYAMGSKESAVQSALTKLLNEMTTL